LFDLNTSALHGVQFTHPNTLRCSALSTASGKEGKKLKGLQTLFFACKREGGRAKQSPGE